MNPQLQGSTPTLQGGGSGAGISLQGNTQPIQGSSPSLQVTANPQSQAIPTPSAAPTNPYQPDFSALNSQFATLQSTNKALLAAIQAQAPGKAATLDINALKSQANAQAEKGVNPLYTNYLNDYLQKEAGDIATAQGQNTMNINAEQLGLANTLQTNALGQKQAGATNELTQGNINASQQNYQLQSGMAQNQKLAAIGHAIGSGNLGTEGLGGQQLWDAENSKVVADAAQAGQFQYQRDTSNLSTQDTFDQLALSSQQATSGEAGQEKQSNFNLSNYLREAAHNDSQYRQGLESQRQQAITAAQQNYLAQGVQSQISNLGLNSKDLAVTNNVYSPYMQTTTMPGANELASLGNTYSTANFGKDV